VPVTVQTSSTTPDRAGLGRAFLVAGVPASYTNPARALENAVRLMQEGAAMMVKLKAAPTR
jgi:ketopantoate hydroxymethyltransferase